MSRRLRQVPPPPVDGPTLRTVSLRRRVALTVLALLVVVLTGVGLLVNYFFTAALEADLHDRLQDRADYAVLLQQQGVTGQELADKLFGAGITSSFQTGGSRYVGRPSIVLPGRPPFGPPPRPNVPPQVGYTESAGMLVADVALTQGTLTLRIDESDLARTTGELRRVESWAGAAMALLSGLAVFFVVGAALRPLRTISVLAERIRGGTRGVRLRARSPHTDLGRTAGAIDEILDALESAEACALSAELRMRQFLADASHDLRTPLAGVIAGSEQLLRNPTGRSEREERLVAVIRHARRASRLVDDLLLVTRLDGPVTEPTGLTHRLIDLPSLIVAEVAALRLRHPNIRVESSFSGDGATIRGDVDHLHRVLANVLENAAQTGTDRIGADLSVDSDGVVVLVRDRGPGVPIQDRERIFDRLVRLAPSRPALPGPARESPSVGANPWTGSGSGLGLPISRAILRRHGGEITCTDNPDGIGACFRITVPRAAVFATPVAVLVPIG